MANDTQKILRELKRTVILASRQARAGNTISGDKLKTLSCLVNSYGRLLQIDGELEQSDEDMLRDGQPSFYESLNQ